MKRFTSIVDPRVTAVAPKERQSSSDSPPGDKTGRLPIKKESMITCKKVKCNGPGNSKCEKRKRATYDNLYDHAAAKSAVIKQANDVQANLTPEFPSFVKSMLPSHVSGGFWLGLPKKFCTHHLPKKDTIIALERENGLEYKTKYLAEKVGLSGGWRGFSMAHKLVEGDVLVFHLVRPSKFKVYIVRSKGSDEVDGALGLLKLDTCNTQVDSEKHISIREEEDKYWEPLAQDIPQLTFEKNNQMICGTVHPVSDQSEDDSKDAGSEILDGIRLCESVVEFKEVKSIEDFSIVSNGLIIDSIVSHHLRTKYYKLCCSQNSFLHDRLLDGLNCGLVVGMISETINIADAIKASKLTTLQDNFAIWDKTLTAFKLMGMNVGFLQTRLDQLMNLALKSKRYQEARIERTNAEAEKRILELKLSEVRGIIDQLDSEALDVNCDGLDVMFQELAKAPW